MLLKDKIAIVYGGGGAIGGAAASAFAREGASVFLAGRSRTKLEKVAADIGAQGGAVEIAEVDALDESAVERHVDSVVAKTGRIDIAMNAVGLHHVQGPPLADLSLKDFLHPIEAYARTHFITAKAAAREMAKRRKGVLLLVSTPGSRLPGVGYLGYGVACAAKEGLSRLLAAELAPSGVRVICLRPHAIPEALDAGSHSADVFRPSAESAGLSIHDMLAGAAEGTLLKRLPTLAEVADVAAFMASDRASAMTGTVANLTCGLLVD